MFYSYFNVLLFNKALNICNLSKILSIYISYCFEYDFMGCFQSFRIRYSGYMKRFLLTAALCAFVFPVFAQDANVITIIREDGSKEVIPLGGPPPPVPEAVPPRAPRVETRTKPAPRVDTADPVVPKIERVAPPTSQPKTKMAKPKTKPAVKKRPKDVLALVPPRKPHRQLMPAGEPITKDKALYIALAEAPPSRDVQVFPVQSEQGLAYSVLFKTEDGMYEVLVDGASGLIMNSGTVQVERSFVEPGHLPARAVKGLVQ